MNAFLTAGLAGIGGVIRAAPEDFVVEEVLAREPFGRGATAWALVEKVGISTPELLRRLGAALRLAHGAFGVAGFKDADAVARQWVSLPWKAAPALARAQIRSVRLLAMHRDGAPLRPEVLHRNRFRVRIRSLGDLARARNAALDVLAVLQDRGAPHYFGPQRFGLRGEAAAVGRELLLGRPEATLDLILGHPDPREHDPRAAVFRGCYERGDMQGALSSAPGALRLERRLLERLAAGEPKAQVAGSLPVRDVRFYLSAWQALLFNRVIRRRLPRVDVALEGDLLMGANDGRVRACADPAADAPAVKQWRVSPTAPLFGTDVPLAAGLPGAVERDVLGEELGAAAASDPPRVPRVPGLPLRGERRPMRVRPEEVELHEAPPDGLELRFALPPGAFATSVLAEVMKDVEPPT